MAPSWHIPGWLVPECAPERPRVRYIALMTMTYPTVDPRGLFGTPQVQPPFRASRVEVDLSTVRRRFMTELMRQLNKHPRKHTPSRNRTMSSRRRAGSRKGNGGYTTLRDRGWEIDWNQF